MITILHSIKIHLTKIEKILRLYPQQNVLKYFFNLILNDVP